MLEPVRIMAGVQRHPEVPESVRIPDDYLERLFRRMDSADGVYDGRIDSDRLREIVTILDRRRGSDEYKKAMAAIRRYDANRDGYLERDEFYQMMVELRQVNTNPGGSNSNDTESTFHSGMPPSSPPWLEKRIAETANAEPYRWCPPPWFILTITLAQIGLFVYHVFHFLAKEEGRIHFTWSGPYQKCSVLILNPRRRRELWRYISYCFVHAGWQHFLVNIFLQLLVGLPLEMSNGSLRIATVYFTGVLAGSLGVSCIKPAHHLAGASAGVFALVGGHCASMMLNWKEDRIVVRQRLRNQVYLLAGAKSGRASLKQARKTNKLRIVRLAFALLLAGMDIGSSIIQDCSRGFSDCTMLEAHLCGLTAGLVVGIAVLKNRKEESWEMAMRVCAIVLFLAFAIVAISWCLFGDDVWRAASGRAEGTWFLRQDRNVTEKCDYRETVREQQALFGLERYS